MKCTVLTKLTMYLPCWTCNPFHMALGFLVNLLRLIEHNC